MTVADVPPDLRPSFEKFYGTDLPPTRRVFDILEEDDLRTNCRVVGDYFHDKLLGLQQKYPIIGDVRAKGCLLGIEAARQDRVILRRSCRERPKGQLPADRHAPTLERTLLVERQGGLRRRAVR